MCSKMADTIQEEEMLVSPSPVASPNTVCTRCSVLEKKIVFYQKKISWLTTHCTTLTHLLIGPK